VTEEGAKPAGGAADHGDGDDSATDATNGDTAGTDDTGGAATDGTGDDAADAGSVDETVESELRSIKEEMDEPQDTDDEQGT
jgi:hypothetical protein